MKTVVTKVVRTRMPTGQEYIFYEERLESHDHVGNEIQLTQQVGRYQKPIFRMEYDPQTKSVMAKEIVRHQWEYDIPYTPEKLDEIMSRGIDAEMTCYAFTPTRKYGINSYEDFKTATFEELLAIGKSGKSLYEINLQRKAEQQIQQQGATGETISASSQLQHLQAKRQEEMENATRTQSQQTKPHLKRSD